jgi:hypothetical protein
MGAASYYGYRGDYLSMTGSIRESIICTMYVRGDTEMTTKLTNRIDTEIDYKAAVKAMYPDAVLVTEYTGYTQNIPNWYVVEKSGGRRLSSVIAIIEEEDAWRYVYQEMVKKIN